MNLIKVKCAFCGKEFFRTAGRVNEAQKFGWKQYCSLKCQSLAKNKQKIFKCGNPACNKTFKRPLREIPPSEICFCSHSCRAVFYNPRRRKIKTCSFCGKKFWGENKKYCSDLCRLKASKIPRITKRIIINKIKKFYKKEGRIPYKEEFPHYNAAQTRFGSWNKSIEAAGFETNPVKFSRKFMANDGHKCDSLAEKIIDDWLTSRKIKHEKNIPYPDNRSLTVDFVTKNNWIEYFGLAGVISHYDELIKKKRMLCKKHNLPLIEIYPKDLFPVNNLAKVLKL